MRTEPAIRCAGKKTPSRVPSQARFVTEPELFIIFFATLRLSSAKWFDRPVEIFFHCGAVTQNPIECRPKYRVEF